MSDWRCCGTTVYWQKREMQRWRIQGAVLSTGATILGDVSIGDFAKIGAGAVVTSDVPSGSTAVGVPARLTNCPDEVPA
jgi:serine O-acetyltransferase